MIQLRAPSSGEMREFIRRVTLTVHYGDSLAVECTSVVHSFLRCIVGLNECTREHPLWFRTPLQMAVPSNSALFEGIGGDFGYSRYIDQGYSSSEAKRAAFKLHKMRRATICNLHHQTLFKTIFADLLI